MQHRSTNSWRRPMFGALMSFPAACFIVTVITDLAYAKTANMAWETFSIWLLTIGLITAALFVLAGLIQGLAQGRWPSVPVAVGYAITLVISLFNAFVHSRDGYTSVVPTGLALSIIAALVIIGTWGIGLFSQPDRVAAAPAMNGTL
jgi:uncharacterized membrane protein